MLVCVSSLIFLPVIAVFEIFDMGLFTYSYDNEDLLTSSYSQLTQHKTDAA